ncbi:MAG TPA: polysaccharide biosynthesis/export family protein [Chthoniobacter sp.]|jgi:protein involved in polysaccharide export with SLBB domain
MKLHLFPCAALCLSLLWQTGCHSGSPHFKAGKSAAAGSANFSKTTAGDPINPAWRSQPKDVFKLGPGDVLDLEIIGDPTTRATTTVGADGKIYFYLLPGLNVWGMTLAETKTLLEKQLLTYVRKPDVAINVQTVGSKHVWVLGRLNNPGNVPLTAPMTVVEAISRAGGLFTSRFSGTTEELADLHHSFLIRGGRPIAIDFNALLRGGDMSQNIYLQPDDYIYLPSALSKEVQVLGAVRSPKPVGFMDQVTLISAISSAGGPGAGAQLSHVAIVRGSLSQPEIAVVDFNAIVTGKQPDIKLEPRDIVYVPTSSLESLSKYAGLVFETFVRTIAANEGGHAVNSDAVPVRVNVGLQ